MSDVSASRAAGLHSQPITLFPRVPPRSFSLSLAARIVLHGRREVCRPRSSSVRHSSHRIQFYYHKKGTRYPFLSLSDDRCLPSITQGLNEAGDRGNSYSQASDDHAYLKNPVWWAGMAISERCHLCASSTNKSLMRCQWCWVNVRFAFSP
jgi:hypothetical protein